MGKGRVKVGEPRKASLIGTKTEEKEPGRTREKEKMRQENSQRGTDWERGLERQGESIQEVRRMNGSRGEAGDDGKEW